MKNKKRKFLTLLSLLLILTMTACGAKANDAFVESAPNYSYDGIYDNAGSTNKNESAKPMEPSQDADIADPQSPSQKLIMTYNFYFETTDFDKSMSFVSAKIKECNGYIESSESYGKSYRNANMVIRIPESKIDLFLNDTGEIGEIIRKSESAKDVTLEYYDLTAKIESLEIQYDRILEILKKADKLSDIITLEARLSELQSELNTYNTRLNVYDNLVNYVTLNIQISEVSQIQVVEEDSFFDEIKKGLSSNITDIIDAFTELLIWLITGIPYFIILGVIAFIIIKVIKKINKKHKSKKETLNKDIKEETKNE